MKTWSPEWLPCTWVAEKRDAMRVCASLDIPFHFLDAEDEYKKGVADYMIAEYRAGRTPNPDVFCNRVVKFGAMWNYAKAHGAEFLATGHYARIEDRGQGAEDSLKKDSQGICFLGDVNMREFLSHYIENKKGDVVDTEGKVIGQHDGVWFYTLGERHGFTIVTKDAQSLPHYVIDKDIEKNQLIVSTNPRITLGQNGELKISLREINWLEKIEQNKKYTAQIRYHGELITCEFGNKEILLKYDGVVPLGQSLVVYDNEVLVGGGIIDSVVI